jgi:hypothetical protein
MEFTMQSGGLPAGSYRAEFVGAEPYNDNADKYGQGVSLKWRVLEGQHAGNEVTRICSMKLTPKTALGKFAVAMKGGAIQTGERFSFASYIGVRGSLLVEATDNNGSRVAVFMRDAQPAAQPITQPQPMAQPAQSVETF